MRIRDEIRARRATPADAPALLALQAASMRILGARAYTPAAIASFIRHAGTMDIRLLEDGTFFVLEVAGEIVACGGWTWRRPSYETFAADCPAPHGDRATVRSVYVDPAMARRGLATRMMETIEADIAEAGYAEAELAATLTAMPLYTRLGYRPHRVVALDLPDGQQFLGAAMSKKLPSRLAVAA
jgi:GNAT superfamily N-acetyltransferase